MMKIPVQEAEALSLAPFRTGAWLGVPAVHELGLACGTVQMCVWPW